MTDKPVALISTPWPLYSRPSIQLAALKSFLRSAHPGLRVDAHHFYLSAAAATGYRTYHDISERTWSAESVYAALLYPERLDAIARLFHRSKKPRGRRRPVEFDRLLQQISTVSDRFIDSIDWQQYGLVGFSVCLCQLTSTLYFVQRIKTLAPSVPVVIGGSSLTGESLRQLLQVFPQIDFAVHGEGELPLSQLVESLRQTGRPADVGPIPGVVYRGVSSTASLPARSQLADLSQLPMPDFDDYFELLASLPPDRQFFPTLSVEMSRGCWWRKSADDTPGSGCAFCNLNLQWQGYRFKPPQRVVGEIEHLTGRQQILSVAFMDNLIPLKAAMPVFETLADSEKDHRLFCEIRAGTPRPLLEKMKRAGVVELQIGIEALSTRLLKKLNKGTTVMENLQIMKLCEELELVNSSNLIIGFPGSDRRDVEETLQNLEFALPFRPVRAVEFWLGLGSPVWQHPHSFGLHAVFNHPNWSILLPPKVAKQVPLMIQAYRGDRMKQKTLWKPVRDRLVEWEKTYEALRYRPNAEPILSYRDGKEFLIIRQQRPNADPMNHRLVGASRRIYLFCRQPRSLVEIVEHFPSFGEKQVRTFLNMMVGKKLMFFENSRYLSLAIGAHPRRIETGDG